MSIRQYLSKASLSEFLPFKGLSGEFHFTKKNNFHSIILEVFLKESERWVSCWRNSSSRRHVAYTFNETVQLANNKCKHAHTVKLSSYPKQKLEKKTRLLIPESLLIHEIMHLFSIVYLPRKKVFMSSSWLAAYDGKIMLLTSKRWFPFY